MTALRLASQPNASIQLWSDQYRATIMIATTMNTATSERARSFTDDAVTSAALTERIVLIAMDQLVRWHAEPPRF
jgi:hypothetical protein